MSQEARTRAVIADEVARITAPLIERLEAVEARLRAVEGSGGPTAAPAEKRVPTGRTARTKAAQGGEPAAPAK